jgi:hypothetical protein
MNLEGHSLPNLYLPMKKMRLLCKEGSNGLRYLRWGGDGEAVQLEKC